MGRSRGPETPTTKQQLKKQAQNGPRNALRSPDRLQLRPLGRLQHPRRIIITAQKHKKGCPGNLRKAPRGPQRFQEGLREGLKGAFARVRTTTAEKGPKTTAPKIAKVAKTLCFPKFFAPESPGGTHPAPSPRGLLGPAWGPPGNYGYMYISSDSVMAL